MDGADYTPALIGLFGVIIGGVLQVAAQIYRDRKNQLYELRKKTTVLISQANTFAALLRHLVAEYNKAKQRGSRGLVVKNQQYLDELIGDLTSQRIELNHQTIELAAWSEKKIADQALRLQKECISAGNAILPKIRKKQQLNSKEARTSIEKIVSEERILRKMIAPRPLERSIHIRTYKRASKMLAKDKKASK